MEKLPPFDLMDLRLLLALAEHRHFAHAARACNLSQPALSGRIRKLETALGSPLVFRSKRFEGFTPEGERALGWARLILTDCSGFVQDLSGDGEGPQGTLRIGVVPSATPFAGRLCGALASRFRQLRPQALSMASSAIEKGLQEFTIDAGITYLRPGMEKVSRALPLFEEQYCLVADPALVKKERKSGGLSWYDAADLPLCLLTPDMQNRRIIDETFAATGKKPGPRFETNSFNAILSLLMEGAYAAVLPKEQAAVGHTEGLVVLDLVEPEVRSIIGLVVPLREPMLPVTAALWDLSKSVCGKFDNQD
ncbi:LysR family transcriptional regulator [Roseibium aggregatum]|uniref:LysR family transcriptional regulator n=1 Tax=Roseibium aggregatum TaxID=187304 RepID=A0A926SAF7_9HYPH|nr:LysR family transcriptional regulator [Roseibium aggregatum]MBD1549039.1 LysR family transcriptional regulator [Roseibium aggregatum]